MLKSSLIEILRTFSKQEVMKFEDFVRSPYFNRKEKVLQLFLEIKKHAPSFESSDLEKERVWEALFPGKAYNYGIMKNLIHDLTKLSEKFIVLEHYGRDSYRCEYDLIEAANGRNIQKYTSVKIDQFEKRVKSEIDPDKYSIVDDYLYVTANYNYAKSSFIQEYNLKDEREESLRLASDHTLFYFLVNSFKLIHNAFAHEVQGNHPVSNTLLDKFFMKLREHSILEDIMLTEIKGQDRISRIVICFYLMYKSLTSGGNRAEYEIFRSYLRENVDLFSAFELQNLNNCRITCAINLESKDVNTARESLEWHKFLMERNIYLQRNGLITTTMMSNIVKQSVQLNETGFAEEFLKRYAVRLPDDSRENTFNYCMALIHFGREEFGKSLECLSKISDEKLIRKYFLKKLYLKIYYELNDYESFSYAFDTFSHFKRRNKLANQARAIAFSNFGNYVKRLFRLRNVYDRFESDRLKKDVLANLNNEQSWFIKKIEEIDH